MQEIIDISKGITKHRKRPLLILVLDNVKTFDIFTIHNALKGKSFDNLDVILQTPGGLINPAFQIIKILRKHAKKVHIIVPWIAKSAGTLICLGGDEILMTELSELGPLDSQITEEYEEDRSKTNSALNGFNALEQIQQHTLDTLDMTAKLIYRNSKMREYKAYQLASDFSAKASAPLYNQLDPKQIGLCARVLDLAEKYGITILNRYMGWDIKQATNTIKNLVWEYPDHDFVIDLDELKVLKLPVANTDDVITEISNDLRTHFINAIINRETIIELIEPESKPENRKYGKPKKTISR